ncbi:MAG: DNA-directed RNA polymerase subunit alpha [Candidatus Berkelbacteria bacterium Licking1014_96]|uniref:DNA-directed RNA polymerase subunit alpha n=1 Tax=Candidatus Berkelbacteria bacterium Licking1014_96 TaxID=2017149 RepID=A0A554LCV6_9BACT|nr:MAG: DNA-directed RNA polymerase subunit alpha [Candidatus Berkelbacteria bacterium Licking1014_96]
MKISLPKIKVKTENEKEGTFIISPLFPGYGVTVGNSLRRVLLSSLGGAAIYEIKVEGASHEFTAIPGVKEDLIEVILAIKKIRLKLHDQEATLKLEAKGPKEITAADIKAPSSVEMVNPDLYLMSLNSNAKVSIEMKVKKGIGYGPSEERKDENRPLGVIAIDSIFTPVQSANFSTEFTRVGGLTNYDKLTLEIKTDSTVTPKEALQQAAEILKSHFELVNEFKTEIKEIESEPQKRAQELTLKKKKISVKEAPKTKTDYRKLAIEEAGFAPRTAKSLLDNKIKTVAGLTRLSDEKLAETKGLGEKSMAEINRKLKRWNLK